MIRVLVVAAALIALVTASPLSRTAGAPSLDSSKLLPFEPQEELIYRAEISRFLLRGIDIAELRFKAGPLQQSDPSTIRIQAEAVSRGFFPRLFGIHVVERVESIVSRATFNLLRTNKHDEQGKRVRVSETLYDRGAGKLIWTERDPNDPSRQPRVVTTDLAAAVQDIASAFYYLRMQKLTPGTTLEVTIADSGNVFRVPVRVSERRQMKTVLGRVWTVRVDPEIFGESRLIAREGAISIWLTDDHRHIPVRGKINSEAGTVNISLKKVVRADLRTSDK